ncbi:hypothetical protein AS156_29495 [Bradyrhizobium macuxiense]|uniref:Uncharacterized protein n=1 Tax=Bradyrhizobium macuxiense TaxID=1755647 RepID=A0A109K408_9BRAD|nr:hypothetical protein AS156_29495 [Bradyrhizobium macuxiense]
MDALIDRAAVEVWPIGRLRPYERNSRRYSLEQIEQIAASIRHWGWTMPILAADDGMVLAGHGRLAAGKLLAIADGAGHRRARVKRSAKARLCHRGQSAD